MKKAVPPIMRPRNAAPLPKREGWRRDIDNYDRSVRRRERKYRQNVVRIDHASVGLISTDRKLPLDRLNALGPADDNPRAGK